MQRLGKSIFDGRKHHVAHHITAMTAGRRRPDHRSTVTAIEGERDTEWLAIIIVELEATGAPTFVARRDRVIVTTLRANEHRSTLDKQTVNGHDPIYALGVNQRPAIEFSCRIDARHFSEHGDWIGSKLCSAV